MPFALCNVRQPAAVLLCSESQEAENQRNVVCFLEI